MVLKPFRVVIHCLSDLREDDYISVGCEVYAENAEQAEALVLQNKVYQILERKHGIQAGGLEVQEIQDSIPKFPCVHKWDSVVNTLL